MPILNYTTKIDASKTLGEIQGILARHGANNISIDYQNGNPIALTFTIEISGVRPVGFPGHESDPSGLLLNFRLPSNYPGVLKSKGLKQLTGG